MRPSRMKHLKINTDGSVDTRDASVLQPGDFPISLSIDEATIDAFDSHSCDLAVFLQRSLPSAKRLVLALSKGPSVNGVILQSKKLEKGDEPRWFKFATWHTADILEFPPTVQLNLKVL
ncbi:uncharacterized protein PG998_010605 [Apiospora kogelbergensis]|uniref:uncharacterized protein n=1 Tax=Apiospora kogelbergensis TaxID=1337665 RepID=UPI00312DD29C